MEGAVEIGAGIGYHVDAAELEGGAVIVERRRRLARPIVADDGTGQALVGGHARLDHMAEVDEPLFLIRHKATAPISIQITFSDAEGKAPCHQPLTMKRSEEHTSELQSLMRISYAVFCLQKKKTNHHNI